eukprot:968812_1
MSGRISNIHEETLHATKPRIQPSRTFTYYMFHIESRTRVSDKAYFINKYLMKEYIATYTTKTYPTFDYIHYAPIIYDFVDDEPPSFQQLLRLKQEHKALVIKPNHCSSRQIIVNEKDIITPNLYDNITLTVQQWLKLHCVQHMRHLEGQHMMKPHVHIEQHLNLESDELFEYKLHVFNGKALLHFEQFQNIYTLPDFKLLNVTWYTSIPMHVLPKKEGQIKIPSKHNIDRMIAFAEHWAQTEYFEYVRVDLYIRNDQLYFNEFAFSTWDTRARLEPLAFDNVLWRILCNTTQQNIDRIYQYAIE